MTKFSMVREFDISMDDDSTLSVCIAIELSTEADFYMTATKQMGKLNIVNGLLPIEKALTHLLCDPICHQDDPDDEDAEDEDAEDEDAEDEDAEDEEREEIFAPIGQ
jgi:hypothetical protein